MQQNYRRTRIPKCDFNKVALLCNFIDMTHWHGCFPVNLLHILKTPFLKNTSGWLLLMMVTPYPPHKNDIFNSGFLQQRWPNLHDILDLVTFTKEILSGRLYFLCSDHYEKVHNFALFTKIFCANPECLQAVVCYLNQ